MGEVDYKPGPEGRWEESEKRSGPRFPQTKDKRVMGHGADGPFIYLFLN